MSTTENVVWAAAALMLGVAGCRIDDGPDGSDPITSSPPSDATWSLADQSCVPFCDRLEGCGLLAADAGPSCVDYCRTAFQADPNDTQNGCSCVASESCDYTIGPPPPGSGLYSYDCAYAPFPPQAGGVPGGETTSGSSGDCGCGTTGSTSRTQNDTNGFTTTTSGTNGAITVTVGAVGGSGTTGNSTGWGSSGDSTSTTTGTVAVSSAGTTGTSGTTGSSGGTTGTSQGTACTQNIDCADDQDCVGGVCLVRCQASCQCALGQSCVSNYCYDSVPPPVSCTVDCECNSGQTCVNNQCQ